MQQQEQIKELFLSKYTKVGEDKFYKFLWTYALNRIVSPPNQGVANPAIELIEYYKMFLTLYRREGNPIYLKLSRQFRKAAHKIYFIMLDKGLMEVDKERFLNVIQCQ